MSANIAYDAIKDIVDIGIEILREDDRRKVSRLDREFDIWFDYSNRMLDRFSRHIDPSIQTNYLRLAVKLMGPNLDGKQKLSACLNYLIESLKYVA